MQTRAKPNPVTPPSTLARKTTIAAGDQQQHVHDGSPCQRPRLPASAAARCPARGRRGLSPLDIAIPRHPGALTASSLMRPENRDDEGAE